jgi:hypothetical protein
MTLERRLLLSATPVLLVTGWFWFYLQVPPDCDLRVDGPCNITMSLRLFESVIGAAVFLSVWVAVCLLFARKHKSPATR